MQFAIFFDDGYVYLYCNASLLLNHISKNQNNYYRCDYYYFTELCVYMYSTNKLMKIIVTQLGIIGLFAYLKVSRNDGLSIQCVIARQWLEQLVSIFYTFYINSLPSRTTTVEVANA